MIFRNHLPIAAKLLILLLLLSAVACAAPAATTEHTGWYDPVPDAYVPPVDPIRTPDEWKKIGTHAGMIAAVSIPEDVLATISTAGLAETCMNYPLMMDRMAYTYAYEGIKYIEQDYGDLQELYERPDAGPVMARLYASIDPAHMEKLDVWLARYRLAWTEFILANGIRIKQLSQQEQLDLLRLVLDRRAYMLSLPEQSTPACHAKDLLIGRLAFFGLPAFREAVEGQEGAVSYIENGFGWYGWDPSEYIDMIEGFLADAG